MLKHYVEYLFQSVLTSETSVSEITERDVINLSKIPDNCVGLRFFDRSATIVDGETLLGNKKNISGWFLRGEKMTLEQIKVAYGSDSKYETLIWNMENNHWHTAVRTRFGRFMIMESDDKII